MAKLGGWCEMSFVGIASAVVPDVGRRDTVGAELSTPRPIFVSLLACALLFSACSATDRTVFTTANLAAELRTRGLSLDEIILPYELTPAMEDWALEATKRASQPFDILDDLRKRLLTPAEMNVEYEWGYTGTAIEVFDTRKANCLAFTNLFLGMARELGVDVYYLGVRNRETYRRSEDIVVVSDHVAVGYGSADTTQVYDFSEDPIDNDLRFVDKLSDITAIAMFHSNRGAEELQLGELDQALQWLRLATIIDPELATAWVNLGVVLRRSGDSEGAEAAYRAAIEMNPETISGYSNLAAMLRHQGHTEEAAQYEAILQRSPSRNPYTYLNLGDISYRGGRFKEAERLYRRAMALNRDDAEAVAALGVLAKTTGDERLARRLLRKAAKIDPNSARTQQLARTLRGS